MSGSPDASTTRGILGFWRHIISAAVVVGLICFVFARWFPGLAPSLATRFVDSGALAFVFALTASISVAVYSLVVEAEPKEG
jgi:drug/metabolite transporter (DMT)-like permease